jgi:hypothetical protein
MIYGNIGNKRFVILSGAIHSFIVNRAVEGPAVAVAVAFAVAVVFLQPNIKIVISTEADHVFCEPRSGEIRFSISTAFPPITRCRASLQSAPAIPSTYPQPGQFSFHSRKLWLKICV